MLYLSLAAVGCLAAAAPRYRSVVGDPGMRDMNPRVMLEAWNFCNGAADDDGGFSCRPSPRYADCPSDRGNHVSQADNDAATEHASDDQDVFAAAKERSLADRCAVKEADGAVSYFWTAMLKSGNYIDRPQGGICAKYKTGIEDMLPHGQSVGFNEKSMNQPKVFHQWSERDSKTGKWHGSFNGTWNRSATELTTQNFFSLEWFSEAQTGRRIYRNTLKTDPGWPWLMLYFGADAAKGFKGGYAGDGRGIMTKTPRSPNFLVRFYLNVTAFTSASSMYFLNMGGCWKLDGHTCDGNTSTDITRYALMDTGGGFSCSANKQQACPRWHRFLNGSIAYRNETGRFPYSAYKYYCTPDTADTETGHCDPYSNPQAQEILKIAPHEEWAPHGFPAGPGQSSWVGQPTDWELNVGDLTARLYFAGREPEEGRQWTTLNIGPEVGLDGASTSFSSWDIADFDVLVPVASQEEFV